MRTGLDSNMKRAARGQTLVLFALMSLVLIAGLGLVIDSGINYAQRRNMQNASDVAALIGGRMITRQATRGAIWDTVFSTAVANGVPNDLAQIDCVYVDDNGADIVACELPIIGANTATRLLPPPATATGIRVRVSEQHTTLFMRAIGIQTSGTAATSTSRAQIVTRMLSTDVILAVCGVDTKLASGGTQSILDTQQVPKNPQPNPTPTPPAMEPQAKNPTAILDSAYSYDWNQRNASGGFTTTGPEFQLSGSNVAQCKQASGWQGRVSNVNRGTNGNDSVVEIIPDGTEYNVYGSTFQVLNGSLGNTLPLHTVNGPLGCQSVIDNAATTLNNCVLIVPIIDTSQINNGIARPRFYGAFLVTRDSNNDLKGKLIKNYPLHGDTSTVPGWNGTWTPSYVGPVSITLVK